jgi:hypothetical protein
MRVCVKLAGARQPIFVPVLVRRVCQHGCVVRQESLVDRVS